MGLVGASARDIDAAGAVLRRGGLVAFPTETVYGLGARADDPDAVARVFAAKGRPADHPLIVHLADASWLGRWAQDVPAAARALAARFWPGPLTLILRKAPGVPAAVTGGQDTIGVRVPGHPVALALVAAAGTGVAAPSANRFGRVSPTTAEHVLAEFGPAVDCVVDGGPCAVGIESTIVDLTGARPRILRPGAIGANEVAEVVGEPVEAAGRDAPRAPGRLPAHYAPAVPLHLVDAAAVDRTAAALSPSGQPIAVLARRDTAAPVPGCRWWSLPPEPAAYARVLYARLRDAEAAGCVAIVVERPPGDPAWDAVRDRLERAAAATAAPSEGGAP
ncbi:MAG: threonylcarbamoyl-AMP synthase [Deltaproteobacteria bacterium]|nr:MAG: threonylcarbamoyl-AMP synthase [Deltaproteobacteria bacterium]